MLAEVLGRDGSQIQPTFWRIGVMTGDTIAIDHRPHRSRVFTNSVPRQCESEAGSDDQCDRVAHEWLDDQKSLSDMQFRTQLVCFQRL
jgi:hypothetical protein